MKLNITAMAATSGLLWGGAVLAVGLINRRNPRYGRRFLELVSSVYPGYHPTRSGKDIATGTIYAVLDGTVWGAIFAGAYNLIDAKSDREYLSRAA